MLELDTYLNVLVNLIVISQNFLSGMRLRVPSKCAGLGTQLGIFLSLSGILGESGSPREDQSEKARLL